MTSGPARVASTRAACCLLAQPGRGQRDRAGQRAQRDQPVSGPVRGAVRGPRDDRPGDRPDDDQGEADRVDHPEARYPQPGHCHGHRRHRRGQHGQELAGRAPGSDRGIHGQRAPMTASSPMAGSGSTILPSRIRTTRSAAAATSGSCVTRMMVWPPRCSRRISSITSLSALGVERAGRLVGQQQGGLVGQGAGDGEPLALAAGQHAGDGRGLVADAEQVEQVPGPGLRHLALAARDDRGQGHVLQHGHALEQVEELEDQAHVAAAHPGQVVLAPPGHQLAGDLDLALVRRVQPGHQVQQRGLAAAGRAHQGDEVARLDGQVHPPQRPDRRVLGLEGLAHAAHDQRGTVLAHHSPTLLIL